MDVSQLGCQSAAYSRRPGHCFMGPLQSGHGIKNGSSSWALHGAALSKADLASVECPT